MLKQSFSKAIFNVIWCLSHRQLAGSYNCNHRLPCKELYSKSPPVQAAERELEEQMLVCLEEAREVLSHLWERNESSEGLCENETPSSNINKAEAGPSYSPVVFARTNELSPLANSLHCPPAHCLCGFSRESCSLCY